MTASESRILIVEDENIVSKDIQARLRSMGYTVCGAVATGEEAVAMAGDRRPDLVLMDIMLRGALSGTDAADRIQQQTDVPIVYLTAYSDTETLERAKVTRPYGYVLKPFDDRDLHTAIEMALYRAGMERKLKEAEEALEAQRARRIRADHLRSLGEMAAGIAHELRQPLTVLYGIADHIKLTLDHAGQLPEAELRKRADAVLEQSERMEHIIERVRMFAREAGKPTLAMVQVNEAVSSAVDMVAHTFRSRGIEMHCDLADELPPVMVNVYSLEEVFLNLLSNARDAVEPRKPGRIWVETLADANGIGPDANGSGPEVIVRISDNGVGVPAEVLEHVFDPFFTTKDVDRGTGLGLSVCKSLVEEVGGSIGFQSSEDKGTAASVRLPVAVGVTT